VCNLDGFISLGNAASDCKQLAETEMGVEGMQAMVN